MEESGVRGFPSKAALNTPSVAVENGTRAPSRGVYSAINGMKQAGEGSINGNEGNRLQSVVTSNKGERFPLERPFSDLIPGPSPLSGNLRDVRYPQKCPA